MENESMFEKYEASLQTPVTVTPQQVADIIHGKSYGYSGSHSMLNSCPCYHLALFYLGVTDSHGVYWPDGKGGNAWVASAAPTERGEG